MKKFSSITRVNSRRTSQGKKLKRIILVGVIALILFFVVPRIIAYTGSLILMPVHSLQTWFAVSSDSLPQFIRERSELVRELNEIKSTQSAQSGDRLTTELLTKENEELRSLLGEDEDTRIVAGVIGRPNKLPYDVLVLDRGSDDGIVEGAPVFIGDNAVIGIVGKVFPKSAVVELITTPGFVVSVYILGPNIYTNAVGIGGGQLRVGVPQGIKLSEGDLVILPGISTGIYGAINLVQSIASEPEQYGFVSPELPLSSLRLVSVGTVPPQTVSFEDAQAIVAKVKSDMFIVPVPEGILVSTDVATTTASTTEDVIEIETATTTNQLP